MKSLIEDRRDSFIPFKFKNEESGLRTCFKKKKATQKLMFMLNH